MSAAYYLVVADELTCPHAGLGRGVQFLGDIGQEKNFRCGYADIFDDIPVGIGLPFMSGAGIEVATEKWRQVSGVAVTEQ